MNHYDTPAVRAARAMSDLNVFGVVQTIMESGCIHDGDREAERIIAICQKAMGRCLRAYDKALEDAGTPYPKVRP